MKVLLIPMQGRSTLSTPPQKKGLEENRTLVFSPEQKTNQAEHSSEREALFCRYDSSHSTSTHKMVLLQ